MKHIVWLASYPRSGNTWFRAFLTNYLRDVEAPTAIDGLVGQGAADRVAFDDWVGCDSGELTADEVAHLRPEVYLHQARAATELMFQKVHDAYTFLPGGDPLFPPEATHAAIYLVRNPLDVCVSLAHLSGHGDHARTMRELAAPGAASQDDDATEANQLPQKFLSWSGHVASWADAPSQRVLVVRYEDMKLRPEETFAGAVRFLGLPDDPARIKRAVAFSEFGELQRQEAKAGFAEKVPGAKSFFRLGEIGGWRGALTPEQAARIAADHAEIMRRFGYLDEKGTPVF